MDGPYLRLALRDGIPCEPPPVSLTVTIRLVLSNDTYERAVTGCTATGPDGNVFERVFQFAQRH